MLLLDEPFGAVDAKIRQELREWLVQLHHDLNVTTLFVTHDQEEAMEVSDRIVDFFTRAISNKSARRARSMSSPSTNSSRGSSA